MDLALNFDDIRFNLKEISESRMLSQYSNSHLYKLLLGAITAEVQELADAIVDMVIYRTIANAKSDALDAIGNIVGCKRTFQNIDDSFWFTPDKKDTSPDVSNWWVVNGQQGSSEPMEDETYRKWIVMKIMKNHNKFSAKPEIENQIYEGLGEKVAIERVGMIEQDVIVEPSIQDKDKNLLSYSVNTVLADNQFLFSYQAATDVRDVVDE